MTTAEAATGRLGKCAVLAGVCQAMACMSAYSMFTDETAARVYREWSGASAPIHLGWICVRPFGVSHMRSNKRWYASIKQLNI